MQTRSAERPNKRSFKWLIPVAVVIVLAVLLVPVRRPLNDGGTVEWRALLYTVTKLHRFEDDPDTGKMMIRVGTAVEILGMEVYNISDLVEEGTE